MQWFFSTFMSLCIYLTIFYKFFPVSAPYVKVYLIDGKHCVEKQKTTVARRTLDPLYQQQLAFTEDYRGKILQVL